MQHDGRYEEASACQRRALELRPELLEALLNQGSLFEELGEMTQAEAHYRKAVELHPKAPGPHARLATLLRGRTPEPDRIALRERLAAQDLGEEQRGTLLFALAHVSDAVGDHLEATDYLEQANAIALGQREKKGKTYNPIEHHRFVDRLIESFTPELVKRLANAGDQTRQPIFVFGMPRSGTTLVEQVLSSHSRVHGAGELRLAFQTFEAIPQVVGRNDGLLSGIAALDVSGVQSLSAKYREGLATILTRQRIAEPPDRVVDKMPDNYLYLGMLSILFPEATFIHVRRDARDSAFSCWMTNFAAIRWANSVDHIAGRFAEHKRVMDHWRKVVSVPVHEVVYERLVDDFQSEAARLVRNCGLEWEPGCLDFHVNSRPVRTASVTQVRQPLYRSAVARWRTYESLLEPLFSRLPLDTEALESVSFRPSDRHC